VTSIEGLQSETGIGSRSKKDRLTRRKPDGVLDLHRNLYGGCSDLIGMADRKERDKAAGLKRVSVLADGARALWSEDSPNTESGF
jgi:hypothetical protein